MLLSFVALSQKVLGKLPPSPNSNANPKPNPENNEKLSYQDLITYVNEKAHCKFHEVLHNGTYKQKKQKKLEETKQTNKQTKNLTIT